MKKASRLISWFLAAALVLGSTSIPVRAAVTVHFSDVKASHWAYSYVERAYSDGAIAGTGGDPARGTGVFSPDVNMTYGQFLTMLMNAFYAEDMAKISVRTPWYAPAVQVAADHQLTYISREQLMSLADSTINRYNMAWILVKLLEDKGVTLPSQQERDASAVRIGDWDTVGRDNSAWPYYVSAVVAAGIISGVDEKGTFNGSGRVTRGAAAVIYARTADKVNGGKTPGQNQSGSIREEYKLVYGDGWNLITVPGYRENLERAFYETYPRVVARWGDAATQKTIPISVRQKLMYGDDESAFMWTTWTNYNREADRWDRAIEVAAKSQETRGSWALTHELTHVVQSYNDFDSSWWVESMASYSHLRYCCWADPYFFELEDYFQLEDGTQQNWNFEAYGGRWFFAYLDARYPTTPQGRGLIDAIHYGIKAGEITSDNISDPNLNAVVKRVTGVSTIDQLRRQFIRELNAGTWVFNGFAGYADNYITEQIPGVPNPTYFAPDEVNLCAGAYTYGVSGETANGKANNLVDGDRSTKWQASLSDVTDHDQSYDVQHSLCITLSKPVTFNTYTLYHENSGRQNTVDWRIWYYDSNAKSWKKLDDVAGNTKGVTSRQVSPVTAQNLWLEIMNPSGSGDGTVRLYELELYDKR